MVQLVDLLDVQLRNLTPGGKDSAARSLNKVGGVRARDLKAAVTFWMSNEVRIQSSSAMAVYLQKQQCFAHLCLLFLFCIFLFSFAIIESFICFTSCFARITFSLPLLTRKSLDLRGVGANSTEIIISFTFPFVSLPEPWANLFICKRVQF